VEEMRLWISPNTISCKFRLQVFALQESDERGGELVDSLIFSQFYGESTWCQLSAASSESCS